jgi:hypothetical protein
VEGGKVTLVEFRDVVLPHDIQRGGGVCPFDDVSAPLALRICHSEGPNRVSRAEYVARARKSAPTTKEP